MQDKCWSLEEIKEAFWEEFHKSGELWFDYLSNSEDNEESTRCYWEGFKESLDKQKKVIG